MQRLTHIDPVLFSLLVRRVILAHRDEINLNIYQLMSSRTKWIILDTCISFLI